MLERYIIQLADNLNLPPPASQDPNQYFHLTISDQIQISIKSQSPGLFFLAQIGPLPPKKREDTLAYLMKANFLGQGTGNYVIGINDDENILTLSHKISYDINYKIFKEIVEDFANYLAYWRGEMQKLQKINETGII